MKSFKLYVSEDILPRRRRAAAPSIEGQKPQPKPGKRLGHNGGPSLETAPSTNPNRISTRFPTTKGATENPLTQHLTVDLETAKKHRKSFEHNVDLTKDYKVMPKGPANETHDEHAERFIEHVKGNLLHIHDSLPEHVRNRARKWYDGAHEIMKDRAAKYNLPHASVAGVYAALSPQAPWHENVSNGDRVMDIYHNKQHHPWTPEMESTAKTLLSRASTKQKPHHEAILNHIRGKTLAQLDDTTHKATWIRVHDEAHNPRHFNVVAPEGHPVGIAKTGKGQVKKARWTSYNAIGKAIDSIEAHGDVNKISPLMGNMHKVRNFYNNIIDPNGHHGDVTIDTHAVAAGLMQPLGGSHKEVAHNLMSSGPKGSVNAKSSEAHGIQGSYPLYAEAYRRAAKERNILPREMQSIAWEGARSLFPAANKQHMVDKVKKIWHAHSEGHISADEARKQVTHTSGGFRKIDWETAHDD
jgi:hypothetical protein